MQWKCRQASTRPYPSIFLQYSSSVNRIKENWSIQMCIFRMKNYPRIIQLRYSWSNAVFESTKTEQNFDLIISSIFKKRTKLPQETIRQCGIQSASFIGSCSKPSKYIILCRRICCDVSLLDCSLKIARSLVLRKTFK